MGYAFPDGNFIPDDLWSLCRINRRRPKGIETSDSFKKSRKRDALDYSS